MRYAHLPATALPAASLTCVGCASPPTQTVTLANPYVAPWTTLLDSTRGMENFMAVGDSNWHAEDGAIQADRRGKNTGFLVSKQSPSNFQLVVEFWSSPDAISGIFIRCADPKVITDKSCYETNIFDRRPDPTFATGDIVHHGNVIKPIKAVGPWNSLDFTVDDSSLQVTHNGVKTAEIDHDQFPGGPFTVQARREHDQVPRSDAQAAIGA